jgi:hypothetical protein
MARSFIIRARPANQNTLALPSGICPGETPDIFRPSPTHSRFRVAHELRHLTQQGNMANKVKLMRFLQEVRGYAQITNRRPAPRPSVLYLMQLRGRNAQPTAPKRRLIVVSETHENANTPLPIKITHLKTEDSLPVVVC